MKSYAINQYQHPTRVARGSFRLTASQIFQNRSALLAWLLIALSFCVAAVPDEATRFKTQILADALCGSGLFLLLVFSRVEIINRRILTALAVAVCGVGTVSALASADHLVDSVTTWRYLVFIPVVYTAAGYLVSSRGAMWACLVLLPSAIVNVSFSLIAVLNPFTGELSDGTYISTEGRYFMFPIGGVPLRPVSLSEACCVGFAMTFVSLSYFKEHWGKALFVLPIVSTVIALVSATRTYVFAVAAVLMVYMAMGALRRRFSLGVIITLVVAFIAVMGAVLSNDEMRTIAEERLERFESGSSAFDSTGRSLIWRERLAVLEQVDWMNGYSMLQYRSTFDLSSHNLYLDLGIVGGWCYLVVMVGVFTFILWRCGVVILVSNSVRWEAYVVLMFVASFLVSSPIMSSKQTLDAFYFCVGALCCIRSSR